MRRLVVESVYTAGAGHLGGSLSAAEILVSLYFEVLDINPRRPRDPDRDRFIMSKGHASIGLYTVLAQRGYFPEEELSTFDAVDSRLQGHPDMTALEGLDMSAGSLGQGLSPGIGMALAARLKGRTYRTFVLLGDGDSQEGQIWEAAFVAERYCLDNLTAIMDWNGLQQYGWAAADGYQALSRRPAQDDPAAKWRAFGWNTIEVDGHDLGQIIGACEEAKTAKGRPSIVIARTVKGKGVSFMENDFNWHAKPLGDDDLAKAREELDAQERALR
jgi:transketolase